MEKENLSQNHFDRHYARLYNTHMKISDTVKEQLASVLEHINDNEYCNLYKYVPSIKKEEIGTVFNTIPAITKEVLRSHSGNLSHYPESKVRYLSSEFDPEYANRLFLFPQLLDAPWMLLNELLKKRDAVVAILSIPLFWQVGPFFYNTCKKNGVPMSVISPRNLPLARQVIKEVEAQAVTGTPEAADSLYGLLSEENIGNQIHTWHLIVPFGENPEIPILPGNVLIEYHVFPGVPIGHTSPELLRENPYSFIPSPEYFFEIDNGTCFITSLESHALPFIRLEIGRNAEKITREGKEIVSIKEYVS